MSLKLLSNSHLILKFRLLFKPKSLLKPQLLFKPIAFLKSFMVVFVLLYSNQNMANIEMKTALTPETVFYTAIKTGKLDDVRKIMSEKFIDPNKPFDDGITPLHVAIINNQEPIAAVLIQAGANVNATDMGTGATPLHMAALYGRENLAKLLIQKGANVNAIMKFNITPLLVACQYNQAQVVSLLISKKANINHADQEGFTALHYAAQNGDEVIAQVLLNSGANYKAQEKTHHATPLMIANENKRFNIVKMLADLGDA